MPASHYLRSSYRRNINVRMSEFMCYYDPTVDSEDCGCIATCCVCGRCTSGSQKHRRCWETDDEISELLAGPEESLPTEEQEEEAIAVQRDTPISMQADEEFENTYQFHVSETSIDFARDLLKEEYPDIDFLNLEYNRIKLHDYLTMIVHRKEFCMMYNQWDNGCGVRPGIVKVRMQKPFYLSNVATIHHLSCIDLDEKNYKSRMQFATLRVISTSGPTFMDFVATHLNFFFCATCEHFIFDTVEKMSKQALEIPPEIKYSKSKKRLYSMTEEYEDRGTKLTIWGTKPISVVSPQKRQKVDE